MHRQLNNARPLVVGETATLDVDLNTLSWQAQLEIRERLKETYGFPYPVEIQGILIQAQRLADDAKPESAEDLKHIPAKQSEPVV